MDVSVDGEPLAGAMLTEATVNDVLVRLREEDEDRMVVALRLDGRDVGQDEIDSVLAMPLTHPGRLELERDSVLLLGASALGQAADALEQTREHHTAIAERLAGGKNAEAMDRLKACFAAWDAAEKVLRQTAPLTGVDLAAGGTDGPAAMVNTLRDHLGHVQAALKIRDFVAVSDLIEYEMPKITDVWQCTLVGLQQRLLERA